MKGIATHLLGDDFSLLSRQRDGAEPSLFAPGDRVRFRVISRKQFDAMAEGR